LASVKRFAIAFKGLNKRLHGLILNAGIMAPPFTLTEDGIESQFQVNFLAHAALANDLVSSFDSTQTTSIVFVSSAAMYHSVEEGVFTDLARINHEPTYAGMTWYGQSKLAGYLYAKELSRHLEGANIVCNALHPGGVKGNLNRFFVGENPLLRTMDALMQGMLYWDDEEAALTVVGAAVSPKILGPKVTGHYFVPVLRDFREAGKLDVNGLSEKVFAFTERLLSGKYEKLTTGNKLDHHAEPPSS
jgi:NAD(P)-dependent dehydrogenase (short-subunit alcohol dehydrogenase family)